MSRNLALLLQQRRALPSCTRKWRGYSCHHCQWHRCLLCRHPLLESRTCVRRLIYAFDACPTCALQSVCCCFPGCDRVHLVPKHARGFGTNKLNAAEHTTAHTSISRDSSSNVCGDRDSSDTSMMAQRPCSSTTFWLVGSERPPDFCGLNRNVAANGSRHGTWRARAQAR